MVIPHKIIQFGQGFEDGRWNIKNNTHIHFFFACAGLANMQCSDCN